MTCRIMHGDCVRILCDMDDDSAGCAIYDAPYSDHTHKAQRQGCTGYTEPSRPGAQRAQFSRNRDLGFAALTDELRNIVASQLARITQRWILAFTDDRGLQPWSDAFAAHGIEWLRTGVWRKLGATPQFTGDRPAQAVEFIYIGHRPGKKRWNGGGRHAWWEVDERADPLIYEHAVVQNRGGIDGKRLHTTQKPLSLMEALVRDFTDKDELILDPFAGSGTTIAACKRLGRRGTGIELDEKYAALAARRVDGFVEQRSFDF